MKTRTFNLLDFLNGITESELKRHYTFMKNLPVSEMDSFLEDNKQTVDIDEFLNASYLKAVHTQMIDYILDAGISSDDRYERYKSESDNLKFLDSDLYLGSTLDTVIDIFISDDFKQNAFDVLDKEKGKFSDKYKEFIEQFLVHEDSYINYLGALMLLGEARKSKGIFDFLSKGMTTKLVSLLEETAKDLYIDHLELSRNKLTDTLTENQETLTSLETQLQRREKVIADYKKKLLRQYEKDQNDEKKILEKEIRNKDAVIKKLAGQLPDSEDSSKQVVSKKNNKKTNNKSMNSVTVDETSIDKLNDIESLITKEIGDLRQEFESFKDALNENNDRLESLTDITYNVSVGNDINEKDIEHEKMTHLQTTDDVEFNMDTLDSYLPEEKNYQTDHSTNKIGYAIIEDNIHYVSYPDGEKCELLDIPKGIYVSDGQFVLTRDKTEFLCTFKYNNNHNYGFIPDIDSFAVVKEKNESYLIDKGDGVLEELVLKRPVNLKENQVIGVTYDNTLSKYYTYDIPNMDIFTNSINAKGHSAYFITEIDGSIATCVDVFSGERDIEVPLYDNRTVGPTELSIYDTILTEEDTIHGVFPHIRFYTNSSYYDRGIYAPAKIKGDTVFIEYEGDLIKIQGIPVSFTITDGQILLVDEYNNLIQATSSLSTDNVKFKPNKKVDKKEKRQTKVSLENNILLIGNLNFEESYKSSLAKVGYDVTVIDGFESWSKILKETKDVDKILVISNHVSHDNMYKLKGNLNDKDIIYPKGDGANRLIEYLK